MPPTKSARYRNHIGKIAGQEGNATRKREQKDVDETTPSVSKTKLIILFFLIVVGAMTGIVAQASRSKPPQIKSEAPTLKSFVNGDSGVDVEKIQDAIEKTKKK
eukprot:GHVH01003702.1.p1 GENE.GHVH01003702.1~~GHVH01003702.1.p1  ORF type:complete len:104 (+),score=13.26 GHVH01003702.1:86-397(+)